MNDLRNLDELHYSIARKGSSVTVRRLKTYTAQTGYVYEYYFVGSRAAERGRTLSDPEQYAAAKLRLLLGFDEISNMLQDGRRLLVDTPSLTALLESVGID